MLELVRIHFIIMMIRWTGLAPWEFEFPFPGAAGAGRLDSGAGRAPRTEFKLPWRDAGPPNHLDDRVDSDQ